MVNDGWGWQGWKEPSAIYSPLHSGYFPVCGGKICGELYCEKELAVVEAKRISRLRKKANAKNKDYLGK